MKLFTVVRPEFQVALSKLLDADVPVETAFKLRGMAEIIAKELKKFGEVRSKLLEKYAEKDDKGKPVMDEQRNYKFSNENLPKIAKELEKLSKIEFKLASVSLKELGSDIKLSAKDLLALGDMVVLEKKKA